ncbi:MAG: glycosyltransferase [Lewinellaceae bacterium]|nr:glycosyltransferase [Lewinellaceae bacterium]
MLFKSLQYVSPTWYFNLTPKVSPASYFLDWDKLSEVEKDLIQWDKSYSSRDVSKLDAAWQAWQKGFIEVDAEKRLDTGGIRPTVTDNYRFLRKYFHPIWSYYVLLLRLLSLHNPFREIGGFLRSRRLQRVALYEAVFPHETAFADFESSLLHQAPRVAVIIPTLNRYDYLKDALHDLEQQDYPNFEVIVVDQSEPYRPEFYDDFQLDIHLIRQEEKALWLARNTTVKSTTAEYLLLYDDDSRVEKDWVSQHIKCLDYFRADISSGVSISKVGAKVPENYRFFRWADQLDTGNVLIKREVFRRIGLFDRQFEKQRMGDGEFGVRAFIVGFKNISNPIALRLHLKVGEGGLRQMGHWDEFRPKSILAPRPVPSVLYLCRKYYGLEATINLLIMNISPSLIPYRYKRNRKTLLLGIPLAFLLFPLVTYQVFCSWVVSGTMLHQGAKIEILPMDNKND